MKEINGKKVFTPTMKDIRVGYEFINVSNSNCNKYTVADFYLDDAQLDHTREWHLSQVVNHMCFGYIKVYYLDNDQIINDGWEEVRPFSYKKGNLNLIFYEDDYTITIWDYTIKFMIQHVPCRDINTLRLLVSLTEDKSKQRPDPHTTEYYDGAIFGDG